MKQTLNIIAEAVITLFLVFSVIKGAIQLLGEDISYTWIIIIAFVIYTSTFKYSGLQKFLLKRNS